MLLSERIITNRDSKIQDTANCDRFYQDLKTWYESDRIIGYCTFGYAFSYRLIGYMGQIKRNERNYTYVFKEFKELMQNIFVSLKRINDDHSSYPDQHRSYDSIRNQQWAYLFDSNVYLKPKDLNRQTPSQTRPSEFYKILKAIAYPFLFERYFIQNVTATSNFWEDGDSPPLASSSFYSDYYESPRPSFVRVLCLVFVANDVLAPYISNIFLCERVIDRDDNRNKSAFQRYICRYGKTTSVVPIFRIEWDNAGFGFRGY